jgi:hypothetical protein
MMALALSNAGSGSSFMGPSLRGTWEYQESYITIRIKFTGNNNSGRYKLSMLVPFMETAEFDGTYKVIDGNISLDVSADLGFVNWQIGEIEGTFRNGILNLPITSGNNIFTKK